MNQNDFQILLKSRGKIKDEVLTRHVWVRKVFYQGDNGFAVFGVELVESRLQFTCIGNIHGIREGQAYHLTGKFEWSPKRDEYQFTVSKYEGSAAQKHEGLVQYLTREAPGIGPALARKLADEYGNNFWAAVETPDVVAAAIKFPLERATELSLWAKQFSQQHALRVELYDLGLGPALVRKVTEFFGKDAVKKTKEDCFALVQVDGIGFLTVCKIADRLGIPKTDKLRIEEGIAYAIKQVMQDKGHVCIHWHELVTEATKLLDVDKNHVIEGVKRMCGDGRLCKERDDPRKFSTNPSLFDGLVDSPT